MGIRSGKLKQGWESSDFPVVCQTCLGQNPYLRMTRKEFDAQCKICCRPFTVFRWQPSGRGRFKKTQICQTCAKMKNVCQTCVLDFQYGLPVEVRDKLMGMSVQIPSQTSNRNFWAQQMNSHLDDFQLPYENQQKGSQKDGEEGGDKKFVTTLGPVISNTEGIKLDVEEQKEKLEEVNQKLSLKKNNNKQKQKQPQKIEVKQVEISLQDGKTLLQKFNRTNKSHYQRNNTHICSFFVKGKCNRGKLCPYRHEIPQSYLDEQLKKQNIKDRFHGVNDPVAKRILDQVTQIVMPKEPLDQNITTLFIGGVNDKISEMQVRNQFKSFGRVIGVKLLPQSTCGFVKFESRESAKAAVQENFKSFSIKGIKLKILWAKENLKTREEQQKLNKKSYTSEKITQNYDLPDYNPIAAANLGAKSEKKTIKKPPVFVNYESSDED